MTNSSDEFESFLGLFQIGYRPVKKREPASALVTMAVNGCFTS
jgi:hypothetical protein